MVRQTGQLWNQELTQQCDNDSFGRVGYVPSFRDRTFVSLMQKQPQPPSTACSHPICIHVRSLFKDSFLLNNSSQIINNALYNTKFKILRNKCREISYNCSHSSSKWQHMRRKRGPSHPFFLKTIFVYFIPKY